MLFSKYLAVLAATLSLTDPTQADQTFLQDQETDVVDPRPPCEQQPFCDRFRSFMDNPELRAQSDVYYTIEADSVSINTDSNVIEAELTLASSSDGTIAQTLDLTLTVYQNGIMRMLVEEPGVKRFRISQDDLQPVMDDNLIPVSLSDKVSWAGDLSSFTISSLEHEQGDESWEYTVELSRFRIEQVSTGDKSVNSLVVNPQDTLYFETESMAKSGEPHLYSSGGWDTLYFETETMAKSGEPHLYSSGGWDISELKEQIDFVEGRNVYRTIPEEESSSLFGGVNRGIGLGFFMPSDTLFGLGEREDSLVLKRTTDDLPYEMWAFDHRHAPDRMNATYGSLPHIQGISSDSSQAITWMNSAHTYIFLDDASYQGQTGSHINFVSETGALELFLFSSTAKGSTKSMNRNQRLAYDLATITGQVSLPPAQILGYHFSKYDWVDSDRIMERSQNFTDFKFPLDVLVMDIQWADKDGAADGYEYFQFNPQNFTESGLEEMNAEVEQSDRFMTTILDPHIKVSSDYFVYANGQKLQKKSTEANKNNIFVKDSSGKADFEGDCWPGNSVWIDYFNENGSAYYSSLYALNSFKGSNNRYYAWNDMNEPSVFSEDSKTMPTTAKHFYANGDMFEHREVHNAYGAAQQRASFNGLKTRDEADQLRPFSVTRSFFLGSQKYGGYWTGDNYSVNEEVFGSIKQIMQNGLGGALLGGADVPGFFGVPNEEIWIRMYQVGMYYPFFRAHTDIFNPDREPWLQTQRVQDAIRDAINRRYDMIHYLYTAFYDAARYGSPVMRPVWFDFADEPKFYETESQFMFGSSMLVAPKLTTPTEPLDKMKMQEVTFTLPESAKWYNYYSKKVEQVTGKAVTRYLPDLEQAVFIKGGSVMPMLEHDECMALMSCFHNRLRLEVYLDENQEASGKIFADDGSSFKYQTEGAYALIDFTFKANDVMYLQATRSSQTDYVFPESQVVDTIAIYGWTTVPIAVMNNGVECSFNYSRETASLLVSLPEGVYPDQVGVQLLF